MGHRPFPSYLFSAFVFLLSRRPRVWEGLGKAGSRRRCRKAAARESSARPSGTGPADGVVLQARGFGAIVRGGPRRRMRGTAARMRRGGSPRPSLPAGVHAARRRARAAASWPATVAASSLRRRAPSSLSSWLRLLCLTLAWMRSHASSSPLLRGTLTPSPNHILPAHVFADRNRSLSL